MVADAQMEQIPKYQNIRFVNDSYRHNSLIATKHIYSPKVAEVSIKTTEWENVSQAQWNKRRFKSPKVDVKHISFKLGEASEIKIPIAIKELEEVFLKAKYILDLHDDWDDEGAFGYTIDSWKSGAEFLINFNKWLKDIFGGNLYLPKMYHGPKGTIDIIWQEKDFRLFINIDGLNNKGNFYSDTPNKQYTEGGFSLDNVAFNLFPLPFKY
jgi:hypothetical protein